MISRENIFKTQWLALFLVLMHSMGARLIPYQGITLGLIVLFLILISDFSVRADHLIIFFFAALILNFFTFRSVPTIEKVGNFNIILLVGFLLANRIKDNAEEDLFKITLFISCHALISFLLYLLVPSIFNIVDVDAGSLAYGRFLIFILTPEGLGNGVRASGLVWEPGLLQFMANICLFIGIKNNKNKYILIIPFLAVVASRSTTGIFVLFFIFLYFLYKNKLTPEQLILVFFSLIFAGGLTIGSFYENIQEKLDGVNTSGLIRARDIEIGLNLLEEHPFFGHGLIDVDYFRKKSNILLIDLDIMGEGFIEETGEFAGGYTNGFLFLFSSYGIFFAVFVFYLYYRNSIIVGTVFERICFLMMTVLTVLSEPITLTSFFSLFVFSGFYSLIKRR